MSRYFSMMAAASLAAALQVLPSHAADFTTSTNQGRQLQGRLLRAYTPPPARSFSKDVVPITPDAVQDAVDARVRSLFDRAADPATKRVTTTSAEKAGLGYFTDHFEEMDSDRDGSLKLDEVTHFFDRQSPVAEKAPEEPTEIKMHEPREIQIIE
jgi:hypothetical protein